MVSFDGIQGPVAACSDVRTASEEIMLDEGDWEEVRRLHAERGWSISAIARHLNLDRKTVRTWLRRGRWQPYRRDATRCWPHMMSFSGAGRRRCSSRPASCIRN
jgi:IS30 family transposase